MILANIAVAVMLHGPGDHWFAPDKVKHFFVSAFVQSVSYSALRAARADDRQAILGASAVSLAVGVGKEWHDRRAGGDFSLKDLTWDVAGAGAATLVLRRTR